MNKQKYELGLAGLPTTIAELDLAPIRMKLMQAAPEGKAWSEDQALEADLWYRRYLAICLKYGEQPVVPNWVIDQVWHQHILDTKKYMEDCEMIFGFYLHHYPYFGLNGDADERDEAFNETNRYYTIEFGEDCTKIWEENDLTLVTEAVGCGGGGSGTGCQQLRAATGMGCNHSGSGTGCGQGGGKGRRYATGMGCNHSGSGTGCGQGGGKGR